MSPAFQRRILHHGANPLGTPTVLSDRVIAGCWFELHRLGGCGAGELTLADAFVDRDQIEIGDWISCEHHLGERWYLGRVEERRSVSPHKVRLRLEGMSGQLNEVFPGGFGPDADGVKPHRLGNTDLFSNDPDRSFESVDSVASIQELVKRLLQQYVVGKTHIQYLAHRVEPPLAHTPVNSLKLRGEETLRSVIKDLAVRARSASWGVDARGQFFFLRRRTTVISTLREGRDLLSLEEVRERSHIYNRLLLTGDYVYDARERSGQIARKVYRFRGNYFQPQSRQQYGDRRIRLWIPWIRTEQDAANFAREFFRTYSRATNRYLIETTPQSVPALPWNGRVRLESRSGEELITAQLETVRVSFDRVCRLRMELGPEDPLTLWPEPPHDERWELRDGNPSNGGSSFSLSESNVFSSDGGGGGSESSVSQSQSETLSSGFSSDQSSDDSSDDSSDGSSNSSSGESSSGSSGNSTVASSTDSNDSSHPTSASTSTDSTSNSSDDSSAGSSGTNSSGTTGSNGSSGSSEPGSSSSNSTSGSFGESSSGNNSSQTSSGTGTGTTGSSSEPTSSNVSSGTSSNGSSGSATSSGGGGTSSGGGGTSSGGGGTSSNGGGGSSTFTNGTSSTGKLTTSSTPGNQSTSYATSGS